MRTMFVVGFLLLVGIPAVAQETRSTISGTVRDEQGVIPGASVKVTNVGTGVTQQLTTNTSGYFEARLLNAGTYDVVIEMTGFKTLRRAGVTLSSGQHACHSPHARDRHNRRRNYRHRRGAAAGSDHAAAGTGARRKEDRGVAAAVEHAGAVRAVRARHDGQGRDSLRRSGIRRRPDDQCHAAWRCGRRRLVDRRGDKQRRQPADVYVSEHGHGAGDARRVDELHGQYRPRHRRRHLDDDQGRHQYAARHGEPPVPGRTSSTRRTDFSKSCSTGILARERRTRTGRRTTCR